jgi:hypothetical protein
MTAFFILSKALWHGYVIFSGVARFCWSLLVNSRALASMIHRATTSGMPTTRELALSFCCPREGESRRIDLVMINPTDREVFHHNATAAVAEHLCEAPRSQTPAI